MPVIAGRIERLARYPVKSMAGEAVARAFVGFAGLYGDRLYAIRRSAARPGFPYLTAREHADLLRYRPVFRDAEDTWAPPNLAEAAAAGATPLYASADASLVDVHTPAGDVLAIDDPRLLERLRAHRPEEALSLIRSDRALTDCRPVSLISLETIAHLAGEVGVPLDPRRFRANLYLRLASGGGFHEDAWVGRRLGIGDAVQVVVVGRDSRCKMITLDPDTAAANPEVMRRVAEAHEGKAGVYAVVIAEGVVHEGDPIALLD